MRNAPYLALPNKKGPLKGPSVLIPKSLGKPRFHGVGTVFRFPFLKRFVVAAFGFHDLAGLRIFVDLHLARLASAALRLGSRRATISLGIEQIDDVSQAEAVLRQQSTELCFELDFLLQPGVTFQGFKRLELLGQVFFKLTKFCEFRDGNLCVSSELTLHQK